MLVFKNLLIISCTLLAQAVYSNDTVNVALLKYAKNCPSESSLDIHKLVKYLTKDAKSEKDKAELFFYWITENIEYDTKGYIYGTYNHRKTNILFTRKGVCFEYADLYKQMCDIAGIKCYIIHGYAKGYGYQPGNKLTEPNHDWNIVIINNQPHFIDPTWGAGSVDDSKGKLQFIKKLKMEYFLSQTDYFAQKHLPEDPRWQLREHPISLSIFLQKTNVKDMVTPSASSYKYNDSILVYEKADTNTREFLTANAAFIFNPSPENASSLGYAYSDLAYDLSIQPFNFNNLKLSINYYKKAIEFHKKRDNAAAKKSIELAKQGVVYCQYRLDKNK